MCHSFSQTRHLYAACLIKMCNRCFQDAGYQLLVTSNWLQVTGNYAQIYPERSINGPF